MTQLSILIPSRNEMWLKRTIEDILEHSEAETEIIAILDGEWADPELDVNPRVMVVHHEEPIGQRAATIEAAHLAEGKYIMKADAHCKFDQGFDRILLEDIKDDWTLIPRQYNLHVFNWWCPKCNGENYMGPTPTKCWNKDCNNTEGFERKLVWEARWGRKSDSMRFDTTLHFQYFGEFSNRPGFDLGIISGYELSFNSGSVPLSVINLLTNLAGSHGLTRCGNDLGFREDMPSDAINLPLVDGSGGIGTGEIIGIGDKAQMEGIATESIVTDMVNDRDVLTSSPRNRTDKPGIDNTMYKCFISEVGTPSISGCVRSPLPVPTTGDTINSEVIDDINRLLGGKFVYSEITRSFHNGSVTLKPVYDKHINDTMSFLGACWMTEKQRFFDLKLCGASFGSWGQMGTEIACKTWLSGGRLCVDKRTWFAHMFRTQGGDFSFPYEISGKQVERAREMTRDLFFNNKYEHQIYPLSWLIDKFKPIPDWHEEKGKAILDKVNAAGNDFYAKRRITKKKKEPRVGVLYYTDNQLDKKIMGLCQQQLMKATNGHKVLSVSLKPTYFDNSIVLELERGYLTMFKQILAGLEALDTDIVFFAEHDILYHPSHFDFRPPDPGKIYYNVNVWKVRWEDGHALHYDCRQTSGLCAYRDLLLEHYRERVRITEEKWNELGDTYQFRQFIRLQGFEPGTHGRLEYLRKYQSEEWQSEVPNIDIRHDKNLTPNRWSIDQFRRKPKEWVEADEVPGWEGLEVMG